MSQGSRPDRVADQIRGELGNLLAREVHDPGIGFVTITRVEVTPDLQHARVFYTALGPTGAEATTQKTSGRALELEFFYDESIAGQDRIEQLLNELHAGQTPTDDGSKS